METSLTCNRGLHGIDYVEIATGDALHTAQYYQTTLGYRPIGYAGLETGVRDSIALLYTLGQSRLLFVSALQGTHPAADFVQRHGTGVKDIVFLVDDVAQVYHRALAHHALPVLDPTVYHDAAGTFTKASFRVYGDVQHSLIDRQNYASTLLADFKEVTNEIGGGPPDTSHFDHFSVCLPMGELDLWATWYQQVLGLHVTHEESIETPMTAMNSKALQDDEGLVKFVLQEPRPGRRKSQIEEFLTFNEGPGIQHIGLLTDDIVASVQQQQAHGLRFLQTPSAYYANLASRIEGLEEDVALLREFNILADRDEWGYLLQIFTQPMQARPTFFIELIQRHQAQGFGSGNIRALFEAVEREQAHRGTL